MRHALRFPDTTARRPSVWEIAFSFQSKNEKGNGRKYHRMERQMGRFSGSVRLHCDMQQVKVDAELKDGALTVRMPQVEDVKSKKLPLRG